MKKLKLEMDGLAVESFDVSPDCAGGAGTVHARQDAADGGAEQLPETQDFGRLGTCLPGYCTCDGLSTCDYSGCYECPPSDPRNCPAGADVIEEKLGPSY